MGQEERRRAREEHGGRSRGRRSTAVRGLKEATVHSLRGEAGVGGRPGPRPPRGCSTVYPKEHGEPLKSFEIVGECDWVRSVSLKGHFSRDLETRLEAPRVDSS